MSAKGRIILFLEGGGIENIEKNCLQRQKNSLHRGQRNSKPINEKKFETEI